MGNNSDKDEVLRMEQFEIEKLVDSAKIVHKKNKPNLKFYMKTFISTSISQHEEIKNHCQKYMNLSKQARELVKLVEVIEEKSQKFCSSTLKLNLIFQYSSLTLEKEIRERRKVMKKNEKMKCSQGVNLKYFKYKDLCKIVYSCLSAMWLMRQNSDVYKYSQGSRFGNMFINCQKILIFEDGRIEIMDPYMMSYRNRYIMESKTYYSPEKITDFNLIDDDKCAIFELAMTLLEACLLETLAEAYNGYQIRQDVIQAKLEKAQNIYLLDIDTEQFHLFQLLKNMLLINRGNRFGLNQTILFAEKMYQKQFQTVFQAENPDNDLIHQNTYFKNSANKIHEETKAKTHSSKKKLTTISKNRFKQFKEQIINCSAQSSVKLNDKVYPFTQEFNEENMEESDDFQIQNYEGDFQIQNNESMTLNRKPMMNLSIANEGVFQGNSIVSSSNYAYQEHFFASKKGDPTNKSIRESQIFTDPKLIQTINRELQVMNRRKQLNIVDVNTSKQALETSICIERKKRHEINNLEDDIYNQNYKITHHAYLN